MAGLGQAAMPDFTFWTPGRIRSWLDQFSTQIVSATRDITQARSQIVSSADGERFLSDWDSLKGAWSRFAAESRERMTLLAGPRGFVTDAQTLLRRYNALDQRFSQMTGRHFGMSYQLSPDELPGANDARNANLALMGWATISIVGIIGLGYLLSNYAKIKTLSKLTFNSRRRRSARRRR